MILITTSYNNSLQSALIATIFIFQMETANHQDYNEDSNSNFSVSNIAPLSKRETTKKITQVQCNPQQKIEQLGYQIVEELSIITPLEIHPSIIAAEVEIYCFHRKLPSVMEQDLKKKQQKEKLDFIMAITSLYKKAFSKALNKFAIILPNGGLVYFFMQDVSDEPKVLIATHTLDFSLLLQKEGIKFRPIKKREYERQRIVIEGQHIRLFFGYFLNYVLGKNTSIQIYANYVFDFGFRDVPMMIKLNENRHEYDHLYYKEEGYLGLKSSKLYLIRFQSIWFKEDIRKIEMKLIEEESKKCKENKVQKIQHEYEFKVNKFTAELQNEEVEPQIQKDQSQ